MKTLGNFIQREVAEILMPVFFFTSFRSIFGFIRAELLPVVLSVAFGGFLLDWGMSGIVTQYLNVYFAVILMVLDGVAFLYFFWNLMVGYS